MPGKRHASEQIIGLLGQPEIELANGTNTTVSVFRLSRRLVHLLRPFLEPTHRASPR